MSQDKKDKAPVKKQVKKPSAEEVKKMVADKQKLVDNNSIIKK